MRIGIAFTLKDDSADPAGRPDDWQEEYDSPATIRAIRTALEALGHRVVELGDGRGLLAKLLADPPDLVFNLAEGTGTSRAREARVPAVCEMLGVPCTGSDPATLAVALDKDWARKLVRDAGVRVPEGYLAHPGGDLFHPPLRFPVILKPGWEGSSKGIRAKCLVEREEDLRSVLEGLQRDYRQPILVEEFIAGDEVTVGIVGNDRPRVLGVMRVVPVRPTDRFVYSLEVKRDYEARVRYECPAALPPAVTELVRAAALASYRALGCRDVARIDFRVRSGEPYFLEANPLPGLHAVSSDLVILAGLQNISYAQLVQMILKAALERLAGEGGGE